MTATIIAEGKTKIIVDARNANIPDDGCTTCKKVQIISKDDITAGDGAAREVLSGKAKACNTTTVNVFKLLKAKGIPTHFLSWCDDESFLALHAEMIPLEVVTRRIAAGSYLKRNPDAVEGQVFDMLEYELFYKDDKLHDPFVVFDHIYGSGSLQLHRADVPTNGGKHVSHLKTIEFHADFDQMRIIAFQVFLILEEAWLELGLVLGDLKVEFGLVDDGLGGKRLVVADVITNDEWRLRDNEGKQLDKQVFRDAVRNNNVDDAKEGIIENYETIAKLSEFLPKMARV